MRSTGIKLLTVLFFSIPTLLMAQPGPPTSGPACWPPPCVPIDGGILLLAAAGAAYGGKKFLDKRKNNKSIS